jgi:hypothetical protein
LNPVNQCPCLKILEHRQDIPEVFLDLCPIRKSWSSDHSREPKQISALGHGLAATASAFRRIIKPLSLLRTNCKDTVKIGTICG